MLDAPATDQDVEPTEEPTEETPEEVDP